MFFVPSPVPLVILCGPADGTFQGCPEWPQDEALPRLTGRQDLLRCTTQTLAASPVRLFFGCRVFPLVALAIPSIGASLHTTVPPSGCSQGYHPSDPAAPTASRRPRGTGGTGRHPAEAAFRLSAEDKPAPPGMAATSSHHTTNRRDGSDAAQGQDRTVCAGVDLYISIPHITMKKKENPNQPVEMMGRGVNAKMFSNVSKDGRMFDKVQIVRTYKTEDGFASTPSFSIDELPTVALYAQRMYELGIQRRIKRSENMDDDDEE